MFIWLNVIVYNISSRGRTEIASDWIKTQENLRTNTVGFNEDNLVIISREMRLLPKTLSNLRKSLHDSDADQRRAVPHSETYQRKNKDSSSGLSSALCRIKQRWLEKIVLGEQSFRRGQCYKLFQKEREIHCQTLPEVWHCSAKIFSKLLVTLMYRLRWMISLCRLRR